VRILRSGPATRALVALAGVSLFATACGAGGGGGDNGGDDNGGGTAAEVEGDSTGVTDTAIRIGTHMPLTGVASPGYSEIPVGTQAYFDFVNAQGGVCDRQIEYTVRDDAYLPANTSQVVNQLVLQDEIFAMLGGLGTPTHGAVVDFLNEEQVPDLFVSTGALQFNDPDNYPYTFAWQPDYTVEGKVIGQYIQENLPDASVALFGQGDDFGRDGFAGVKQYIEDQVVTEQTYTPGNTDISAQITGLVQAQPDIVISFSVPIYTALSQLGALRANFSPQWFISNVGSDPTLVGALVNNFSQGAVAGGSSLLDGVFTTSYIPTVEQTDNAWVELFNQAWDEHGGEGQLSNFKVFGMAQAYTLLSALVRICDNLNREALVAVIQEEGADWEGPWLAPLDYSETSHRGISGVQVVQLENGGVPAPLGDIQLTDPGDGELEAYTEEDDTVPENGIPSP
jgi:branched-chain amino acid transport system substrate-binding protein